MVRSVRCMSCVVVVAVIMKTVPPESDWCLLLLALLLLLVVGGGGLLGGLLLHRLGVHGGTPGLLGVGLTTLVVGSGHCWRVGVGGGRDGRRLGGHLGEVPRNNQNRRRRLE